jgi:hypothetical protein
VSNETLLEQPLLRSKEVARLLDISPDEALGLANRGLLKGTKECRFWRFRPRHVAIYKRQQTEEN